MPSTQKVFLKRSTRSLDPIALLGLSDNFTVLTHSPRSSLHTAAGLITTENDQNGPKFSFDFGNVHFVLLVSPVPNP